jgi:hypothetical protein
LNGGGKGKVALLLSLLQSAFPGSSSAQAVTTAANQDPSRFPATPLETFRFGKAAAFGGPPAPLVNRGQITELLDRIESIREYPFPSDFDPPKGMVERPVMKKALPDGTANKAQDPASVPPQKADSAPVENPALPERMTQALWEKIAVQYRWAAKLDESSRRFMMAKMPVEILLPEEIAESRPNTPDTPFGKTLRRFTEAIARDMLRNEYFNHSRIHQWLEEDTSGTLSTSVEELNRKVYEAIFLTPDYDAWLGLVPEDTYTALEKDGCACDKGAPPMRAPQVAR